MMGGFTSFTGTVTSVTNPSIFIESIDTFTFTSFVSWNLVSVLDFVVPIDTFGTWEVNGTSSTSWVTRWAVSLFWDFIEHSFEVTWTFWFRNSVHSVGTDNTVIWGIDTSVTGIVTRLTDWVFVDIVGIISVGTFTVV